MDTFVNVIIASVTLIAIMGLIVGATIKINTLMTGRIINFLLNKKLLLIFASIISAVFTLAFIMSGLYIDGWPEVFWLVYFIGFIFIIAKYIPELVLHLKKIHLSNLEDAEEQELKEAELRNYS
jgi:hypothetical protein